MTKQEQVKTPELDKMLAIHENSQTIGEFLEWLSEEGIALTYWIKQGCEMCGEAGYKSINENREQLLADYFGIDLAECEAERQTLLEAVREDNR